MSQTEFARKLKIHKNTLGRYERGVSEPDIGTAREVCTLFGVEPRWFLFGEGPMRPSGGVAAGQPGTGDSAGETAPGNEPVAQRREAAAPPRDDEELRREVRDLLQENKELRRENRELNRLVRELLEENGDLRVAVAENKAGPHGARRG